VGLWNCAGLRTPVVERGLRSRSARSSFWTSRSRRIQQVAADGATWLDRQLVARDPAELSRNAFGAEVRAALERRIDVLADQGLAQRDGNRVRLRRNLIETLRDRELDVVTRRLIEETGLPHLSSDVGEQIWGGIVDACHWLPGASR
jgi:hypothetical protein